MSGRSLMFNQADRDERGRIAVDTTPAQADERPLANLLPPPGGAAPAPAAAPSIPPRRAQLAGVVMALLVVGLGVLFVLRAPGEAPTASPAAAPAAAAATTEPAPPSAAPAVAPVPTASAAACSVLRAAPTFYAPDGAPTGDAAERGQACVLVAWHSGMPDWRQVQIAGSAPVWVVADRLSTTDTAGLVDLAPPPTATPAPAPVVIIREVPAPPAPPEPTRCASYSGGGVSVERCGGGSIDELQAAALAAWKERMKP